MLFVVDANIIFSCLIAKGLVFEVFLLNKLNPQFRFIAPEFLFIEINRHFEEIIKRSKLLPLELSKIFNFLKQEIEFIPKEEFKDFFPLGKKISPDAEDAPYFALALRFNCGIFSGDKRLKEQVKIKIFSPRELLNKLLFID